MLPLKHLFDNRPLAELLRAYWDADDAPLKGFRISSNAVYPFRSNGELLFLRFAPADQKRVGQLEAELDFIGYLLHAGYGAAEPVPARDGRLLVTAGTSWGPYLVAAFRQVPGLDLERVDLDANIVERYGRALGELHRLSEGYRPVGARRWSYTDALDWMQAGLVALPGTGTALDEVARLGAAFAALPRTDATYGLVHYDFECDNTFYDAESGRCFVIDFDDAMYHWFAMDVEAALNSLAREGEASGAPEREQAFLAGYAAIRPLPTDLDRLRPLCRRFADLYRYVRVRRCLAEPTPAAPDWMVDLRARLEDRLPEFSAGFGQPTG